MSMLYLRNKPIGAISSGVDTDYIKYVDDSTTYTLPTVGNAVDVTKSVELSGYKLVAITNISPNASNTAIGTFLPVNDNTAFMSFINTGNSSQAGQSRTATWTNVYMKE